MAQARCCRWSCARYRIGTRRDQRPPAPASSALPAAFGRARARRRAAFPLDRHVDSLVAAGVDREEAARRARVQFSGLEQVKEEYRDAFGVRVLDDVGRDVRYAIRTLRRSPGFAATAIVSLALGVGANTLVFSVVNGLVMRPLPVRDPERVVFLQRTGSFSSHSFPAFRTLARACRVARSARGRRGNQPDADGPRGG